MPGRDGTGPKGLGPMTGRRAGFCKNSDENNAGTSFYVVYLKI